MSTITKKSYDDQLLDGLDEWRKQHPDKEHWNNEEVAQFLMDKKGFGLTRPIARKELAKRLAKAQNRKRVRNSQGKKVRVYHAAKLPVRSESGKEVQKTFWGHRSELSASFAHKSMEQRQKQAEGFLRSMHNDSQDLNKNNENLEGDLIQLVFDFRYVCGDKPKQSVQVIPIEESYNSQTLTKEKPR